MKSVFRRLAERAAAAFGSARALMPGSGPQSMQQGVERRSPQLGAHPVMPERRAARRYVESSNRS
jgi:hypothetical protein